MKYRVHRFSIRMTSDQQKLEKLLNSLEGEVVSIIPNHNFDRLSFRYQLIWNTAFAILGYIG